MSDDTDVGKLNLTNLDIADVPFGYSERVEFGQIMSGNFVKIGQQVLGVTTGAINLYVAENGDDSNRGTADQPFATIPGALGSLPRGISHPVYVTVSTGSYAGSYVSGFIFDPAVPVTGAFLVIQGTFVPATLETGPSSGTVSSAVLGSDLTNAWGYVTASSSPGWTVNNLRAHHVWITAGTGAGQVRVVAWNDASTFTIVGGWATVPDATSQFSIVDPGTTISTGVPTEGTPDTLGSSTRAFVVENIRGSASETTPFLGPVVIQNFHVSGTVRGVVKNTPSLVTVRRIRLGSTTSGLLTNLGGPASLTDSIITGSYTTASVFRASTGVPSFYPTSLLARNFVFGQTTAMNVFADAGRITHQSDYFVNNAQVYSIVLPGSMTMNAQGIYVSGSGVSTGGFLRMNQSTSHLNMASNFTVISSKFDNLNKIFEVRGPAFVSTSVLTGSGNATAFDLSKGAIAQLASTTNAGSAADLTLDGNTFSYATMRGLTPKALSGSSGGFNYGTMAYE